ncbi:hypothetical protein ACSBR2_024013 [Camellia fascicularis]
MAGMCCRVVGETETTTEAAEPSLRVAKRRRMEIHQLKILAADMAVPLPENGRKRQKLDVFVADSKLSECGKAVENCVISEGRWVEKDKLDY